MKKQNLLGAILIIFLATSFFTANVYAEDKGNENNSGKIPDDIKLKKLSYDHDTIAYAIDAVFEPGVINYPENILQIVNVLKKYPSEDGLQAMLICLNNYAMQLQNGVYKSADKTVFTKQYQSYRMLLTTIESLMSQKNKEQYDIVLANLHPFLSKTEKERLAKDFDKVALQAKKNKPLRTLNDILNNPFELEEPTATDRYLLLSNNNQIDPNKPADEQAQKNIYAQERKELKNSLERNIIGQPELIDALVELRIQSLLTSGHNYGSNAQYILGARQSGKATAVRAFVKAIHPGDDKALDKHLLELREPVRSHDTFWKLVGSSNGYQGAEEITPFMEFLVNHSAGRYHIIEEKSQQGVKRRIIEDPEWRVDNLPPNQARPEDGVIYIRNFQNWGSEYKDRIVKELMKSGCIELQKNSNGLFKICAPVTIIISSDEGQLILSTRDQNGHRRGYSFTQQQVEERWKKAHKDDEQLKNAIRTTSQKVNQNVKESPFGTSEDLLGLFTSKITLLRPLPNDDLMQLGQLKIDRLNEKLQMARTKSKLEILSSDKLLENLAKYKLDVEASSAAVETNVEYLLEKPLLAFLSHTEELYGYDKGNLKTEVEIVENEDGTKSLKLNITNADYKGPREFTLPIAATMTDKYPAKLSKERIEFWSNLVDTIQRKVFGISKEVAERIAYSFMLSEDRGNSTIKDELKREGALIMAFLGLSSTGKSELTGVLSEATLGHRAARFVIDFNQVKTLDDIKAKILGIRDSNGNCKPSDFIQMYSRSNGNLLVVFEEMANAPRELLKATYDILREPIVTTFCDGVQRSMKQVKIVITGNAGEEIFKSIPSNIHPALRAMMWQQFYNYFMANKQAQRMILEQYFSAAQINRMGDENINFMSPLNFKSRWELIQMKINDNLKGLIPDNGRYGWQVQFATEQDLKNFMELVDEEGFVLEEQGASIDRFVKNVLDRDLRAQLIKAQVTNSKMKDGSVILLKFDKQAKVDKDHEGEKKTFKLQAFSEDMSESVSIDLPGHRKTQPVPQARMEILNTAIHEVGHLVSTLYLSAKDQTPTYVTILPGVTYSGKNMIMYLGVSMSKQNERVPHDRQWIIQQIATYLGGYMAEEIFFGSHTLGVSNDFENAAAMAQKVVLQTGFSKEWGINSVPENMSMPEYIASLPEADKKKLKDEVTKLLEEAKELSKRAIEQAMREGTFEKFTAQLAETGKLTGEQIKEIADTRPKNILDTAATYLKWTSAKSILNRLNKGQVTTIESLIEAEISSQRSKAIQLNVPVYKKSADLQSVEAGCAPFLK